MRMVDTVSETLRQPWSEIWLLGIYEFFNVFAYAVDRARRREEEIRKWKKSH